MPKCDFNKVARQLYWNHNLAWCSPVNLLNTFRTPFLKNTSEWLLLSCFLCLYIALYHGQMLFISIMFKIKIKKKNLFEIKNFNPAGCKPESLATGLLIKKHTQHYYITLPHTAFTYLYISYWLLYNLIYIIIFNFLILSLYICTFF